jgi:hypothetical protein
LLSSPMASFVHSFIYYKFWQTEFCGGCHQLYGVTLKCMAWFLCRVGHNHVHIHRIWLCIWWFPCQKIPYDIRLNYMVYI